MLICRKCRTVTDEGGRAGDGYFTCGYGGSHVPIETTIRPAGRAGVSKANRRGRPRRVSPIREVIRQQELQDAREAGRADAAVRQLRLFTKVSERD